MRGHFCFIQMLLLNSCSLRREYSLKELVFIKNDSVTPPTTNFITHASTLNDNLITFITYKNYTL